MSATERRNVGAIIEAILMIVSVSVAVIAFAYTVDDLLGDAPREEVQP